MKTYTIFIFWLILCMSFKGQSGFSQYLSRKEKFNNLLKSNDLSFTLPKGYVEVDSSLIKRNFSIFKFRYSNLSQLISTNGNVMIYPALFRYDTSDEDDLKRLYPDRNIDIKNDHLSVIRKLVSYNNDQSEDNISFNEKDINFYCNKDLKRLGADIAGDYTIKLTSPYQEEYNYLTFKFIGKYYKLWIYTYIFYKEYNPKTAKKTLKETLFLFRFH